MFDIAPSELMIVALVTIVLVGPKDLPRVMRAVGHWVGKGRAFMRQARGALDDMMREAEIHEIERKRKADLAQAANENGEVTAIATEPHAEPVPAVARGAVQ